MGAKNKKAKGVQCGGAKAAQGNVAKERQLGLPSLANEPKLNRAPG